MLAWVLGKGVRPELNRLNDIILGCCKCLLSAQSPCLLCVAKFESLIGGGSIQTGCYIYTITVQSMGDMVRTNDDLDRICEDAMNAPWLGVDTEFERIRTYYPKLCLLQLSTPDWTVCIDPLAKIGAAPLSRVLGPSGPLKIIHSARQDQEVIHCEYGVLPAPLFDTQIAASFCGFGEQVSYAALVDEICSVKLAKSHTRTAWCRRPLTPQQIDYALDDARYLGRLYARLDQELARMHRGSWAVEEFEALCSPGILEGSQRSAVEKVSNAARSMDRVGQSIASVLVLWREQVAKQRNLPRQWILSDKQILAIAVLQPRDRSDLRQLDQSAAASVKRWGDVLIEQVAKGQRQVEQYAARKPVGKRSATEKALDSQLWTRLKELAAAAGIPTSVVARRDELRALARGDRGLGVLSGWRYEFAGRELLVIADKYMN